MSYAPDGRLLSPGEVIEEETVVVDENPVWQEDLNVELICPDCQERPPNLIENASQGDTCCASCGRVLAERNLDYRSEWRTFSNDDQGGDDPSRVGEAANPLFHGAQLSTEIAFGDANNARARDLSRTQAKSNHDKTNKSLQAAYAQIQTLCESFGLVKQPILTAQMLYKLTDDGKIFKGKSQDAVIAGCIFIACRQHEVPRSFREIYKLTKVSKKEIGRTFKILEAYLQKVNKDLLKANKPNATHAVAKDFKSTHAATASDLIERACRKLKLEKDIIIVAKQCAEKVTALGLAAGRSPLSITGACIYLVAGFMGCYQSPKAIGNAVEVSDGTIRTAYKLIHASVDKLVDDSWVQKGGNMRNIPQV